MLKLVIVEDQKSLLEEMVEALEGKDYTIFQALTGGEAISIIKEQKPELLILDLYLEDMSGLRVLREAKAVNPKTCVIVLTGFNQESTKEKAYQMGADYFLVKPIPLATLKDVVFQASKGIMEKE